MLQILLLLVESMLIMLAITSKIKVNKLVELIDKCKIIIVKINQWPCVNNVYMCVKWTCVMA